MQAAEVNSYRGAWIVGRQGLMHDRLGRAETLFVCSTTCLQRRDNGRWRRHVMWNWKLRGLMMSFGGMKNGGGCCASQFVILIDDEKVDKEIFFEGERWRWNFLV